MTKIRPVSDLRNKYPDIEKEVQSGEPVFLTKNGYGSVVVMSLENYDRLTDSIESKLDEADYQAANTDERLSHQEVFDSIKKVLNDKRTLQA